MADADIIDPLTLLPEERPFTFERLDDAEKAWRGRYFLMAYAMGASEEYAWWNALHDDPAHVAEARAIVATVDDAEIVHAMQTRDDPGRPVLPWTPIS